MISFQLIPGDIITHMQVNFGLKKLSKESLDKFVWVEEISTDREEMIKEKVLLYQYDIHPIILVHEEWMKHFQSCTIVNSIQKYGPFQVNFCLGCGPSRKDNSIFVGFSF